MLLLLLCVALLCWQESQESGAGGDDGRLVVFCSVSEVVDVKL